jgi:hypothetical protein
MSTTFIKKVVLMLRKVVLMLRKVVLNAWNCYEK